MNLTKNSIDTTRALWGLEEDMIFLNHGSYGATPLELLEEQRRWQTRLERQPCQFINEILPVELRLAAEQLAAFVGTTGDALAFVENTTGGVGAVLRSLSFQPGDVIVVTDHIYNAIRQTLLYLCAQSGAELRVIELGLPVAKPASMAETLCAGIDGSERLVLLDHISSASAVIMPVEDVALHCRKLGVPLLIDGAHAPAMLALNLDALDPDYYVANNHKWLCAPKGSAFIRVAERAREGLHPLAISHHFGAGFPAEFDMVGTRDSSSHLTVPLAIAFHKRLGGKDLFARNHQIVTDGAQMLADRLGTRCGAAPEQFGAMATIELPDRIAGPAPVSREKVNAIKARLWNEHRVEVHAMPFAGRAWLRICIHAYNEADELDRLADILTKWS